MLYLRIFPARKFRLAVVSVMGLTVAYTLAAVLMTIFACKPISKSWNKTLPGVCVNSISIWYCKWKGREKKERGEEKRVHSNRFWQLLNLADCLFLLKATSVLNIVTDTLIIGLPINEIRRLQLPMVKKLLLCGLFSLGTFVIACTIIRMITVSPQTTAQDQTCQSKDSSDSFRLRMLIVGETKQTIKPYQIVGRLSRPMLESFVLVRLLPPFRIKSASHQYLPLGSLS
jgi:hypothetical protein